jgi:RNA polymerase sigma-70 factor (ECF subfamily)
MAGTHDETLVTLTASATMERVEPDAGAFERVYAEHFEFVWRCLQNLGVSRAALDDAAQDVFVVVHRRLPEFEGRSQLRTWLYGIVRNVAFKQRRRSKRKPTEPLEVEPPSSADDPHQSAQDLEAARFVQSFLDTLDERKREVFVLCVLEQMSVPEVAEALGIPLNTGYSRLRAARAAFRAALASRKERSP